MEENFRKKLPACGWGRNIPTANLAIQIPVVRLRNLFDADASPARQKSWNGMRKEYRASNELTFTCHPMGAECRKPRPAVLWRANSRIPAVPVVPVNDDRGIAVVIVCTLKYIVLSFMLACWAASLPRSLFACTWYLGTHLAQAWWGTIWSVVPVSPLVRLAKH